jgi:formylglycine-generating enzyme required for sulfatase activity
MATLPIPQTGQVEPIETVTLGADGQVVSRRAGQVRWLQIPLNPSLAEPALALVCLAGGTYQMGSAYGAGLEDARPAHLVSVAPFCLARGLTTQGQWKAVAGRLPPCRFKGDALPIENVSCADAQDFCRRLERLTGLPFRLPAEAEWEYACRAGTGTPFSTGETITTDYANYCGDHVFAGESAGVYRHTPTPAGTLPPNPYGIYDLHGNLWEMCADAWHTDYTGAPFSSQAWESGGERGYQVARGGSWHETPGSCRSAMRLRMAASEHDDVFGFRVALSGDLPD